ncbi:MAG TPA: hypothetical protein VKH35_03585, partial [Thermoanaerobaculia bacterium]|nr:hypothetical protein [Thermoanaerobaculia bacterium]
MTERPIGRAWAAAAVAGVVVAAAFLHLHGVNGPDYWRWEWRTPAALVSTVLLLALAASPALVAQRVRRPGLAVALLCVAVMALQLTANAIEPGLRGTARIRRVAADQLTTSYYTVAESIVRAEQSGHPVDWIRQYDEILRLAPQHATTKPPGPIAFYVAVICLFGTANAPLAAAGLLALFSAGSVAATWWAARTIAGDAAALQSATLMALAPSMAVFFLYLDPAYPILSCAMLVTWYLALKSGSAASAVTFGLVLFLTTLTSYTLLVMGFVLAGMTIFSFGSLRTPQSALRMIRMETIGFSVFLAAYGVLWLSTGFNPVSAFRTAVDMQYRYLPLLHRPYPETIPWDALDFCLGSGWVPVLLAALWLTTRRNEQAPRTRSVVIWGLLTPAVVALTGLIQAETARVWIFLLPLLMIPAGLELSRWPPRLRAVAHVAMIAVTIALYANMTFIGISSRPPPRAQPRAASRSRACRTVSCR